MSCWRHYHASFLPLQLYTPPSHLFHLSLNQQNIDFTCKTAIQNYSHEIHTHKTLIKQVSCSYSSEQHPAIDLYVWRPMLKSTHWSCYSTLLIWPIIQNCRSDSKTPGISTPERVKMICSLRNLAKQSVFESHFCHIVAWYLVFSLHKNHTEYHFNRIVAY